MIYNFDEVIDRVDTACVKYDFREKYFGTNDVLPMWVADMDFRTPDFIINAIEKRLQHEILGYTIRPETFNKSIIGWMKGRHNWNIDPEWISFSPGVVPALSMAVQEFTDPGDKIIIQPPVYFPFYSVIEGNKRQVVLNPLKLENGRMRMDLDDFRTKIDDKLKMLIISSPHNPGGSLWTHEELKELGEICLENNILILSDEIHSDLILNGKRFIPFDSVSEEIGNNMITFMAPSKTFNIAGLSTSVVISRNKDLLTRFNKIASTLHLFIGNVFGVEGLIAAYTYGDDWLDQLLEYLKGNFDLIEEFMSTWIPEIIVLKPEATYMAWLDCNGLGMNDEQLKKFMVEEAKVGMNHGPVFGMGGEGFQRLNFACPKIVLEDGLERIRSAVERLRK